MHFSVFPFQVLKNFTVDSQIYYNRADFQSAKPKLSTCSPEYFYFLKTIIGNLMGYSDDNNKTDFLIFCSRFLSFVTHIKNLD